MGLAGGGRGSSWLEGGTRVPVLPTDHTPHFELHTHEMMANVGHRRSVINSTYILLGEENPESLAGLQRRIPNLDPRMISNPISYVLIPLPPAGAEPVANSWGSSTLLIHLAFSA